MAIATKQRFGKRFSSFVKVMAALTIGVGCLLSTPMGVSAEQTTEKSGTSTTKSYWETSAFTSGVHDGTTLSGTSLTLNPAALKSGTDTTAKYNSGSYYYGTYTTGVINANFMEAIASWQANTPPGTWTEVELSAQVGGAWTKWYSMGVWLESDLPFKRHSVSGQGDTYGTVYTDTLAMAKTAATAVKARVTLFTTDVTKTPTLRSVGVSFANGFDAAGAVPSAGLTSDLAVPKRSQMVFPDGGEVWCSPTSTSMVMAYWANVTGNTAWNQTVPTVVKGVWDYRYNGGGNWPYNTAYAASFGLQAKTTRLSSLAEVEQWTKAGVPVITSIAYKKGALDNSPIASTAGHLLVIRGFDAAGNVLTNDPAAASDEAVGITYDRVQFEKAWLDNSNGLTYLIYPQGWTTPATNGHW